MNAMAYDCDVLIIGHSTAGSTLARHLRLSQPDLNVTVVDKKTDFTYWVGESMLEIFWDYAAKDLKLGHYLDCNHLLKHGLRFFFDSEAKDLPLTSMSEIGRTWHDTIPSHQIDRKRFDQDMYRMNVEMGVDVRLGVKVEKIDLDRESGHVVTTDAGDIRCKWLVDASGLNTLLGRKLDLIEPLDHHPVSSRWARFKYTTNPEFLGDDAWRERVNFMNRFLSTTHFMYKGYWFWVIPLDEETFSIGIVWRHDMVDLTIKSESDFESFIKEHAGLSELLGDKYEMVDFYGLKNMARVAKQFYSYDRWFLAGMSAGFMDPLFSSGSAFIAEQNRMIVDMIATDRASMDREYKNKAVCYDAHSHWWLDNFLLHISGNYHGSFDLHDFLFESLLADYFGIILPAAMSKNWGYDPSVDYGDGHELRMQKKAMIESGVSLKIHSLQHQLGDFIEKNGGVFVNNRDKFSPVRSDKSYMSYSRSRGKTLDMKAIMQLHKDMLVEAYKKALMMMAETVGEVHGGESLARVAMDAAASELKLVDAYSMLTDNVQVAMG